jgi:hypothetical protein
MAVWHQMLSLCVSMERAMKTQHSDQGIKSIGPSGKKWEQKLSDGKFSFVRMSPNLFLSK